MIRVLLADDDADVRAALSELLTSDPHLDVVAAAADGRQALELLESAEPDVAVLDVRMPHGGANLVREFVSRNIPVVCFSADTENREQMLAAGALRFLIKGEPGSDITAAIHEVGAR